MTDRKVALITGAGTGVGAATALMLSQQGYDIVVNYSRSEKEAQDSATACQSAGAQTLVVQASVAEFSDCTRLAQAALARFGRIDVLVNNAGVTNFAGLSNWDALDMAEFQRIYAVNSVGTFQMVRACLEPLKAARGCVVNVSSMAGISGAGSSIPYIMSKGALNTLTLHLARQLAPEIRVNAVCPGFITSRWFSDGLGQASFEKIRATSEALAPLKTACSPEDVADAIVWMVTGARTLTGEILQLDAGMHLGHKR
jgi:3-oxoacyl-[acyl-carrier protein] reductase